MITNGGLKSRMVRYCIMVALQACNDERKSSEPRYAATLWCVPIMWIYDNVTAEAMVRLCAAILC